MAQWEKCLPSSLMTLVQCLGPRWWEEKTDSPKSCPLAKTHANTFAHT